MEKMQLQGENLKGHPTDKVEKDFFKYSNGGQDSNPWPLVKRQVIHHIAANTVSSKYSFGLWWNKPVLIVDQILHSIYPTAKETAENCQ